MIIAPILLFKKLRFKLFMLCTTTRLYNENVVELGFKTKCLFVSKNEIYSYCLPLTQLKKLKKL